MTSTIPMAERLRDRRCVNAYGQGTAFADPLTTEAAALIETLVEALEAVTPTMPPKDAICHVGICSQEKCGHCSRIAKAHDALRQAKGE